MGRVTDCSSCFGGYFHICEELYSFRACEMSPHRSPLQLQVHSKAEGLKQKTGTPQHRLHSLWTRTGSGTTRGSHECPLSFEASCTRHRRMGVRRWNQNHTFIRIPDFSSGLPQFL